MLAVDEAAYSVVDERSLRFRLVEGGRYRNGRTGDIGAALAGPLGHRAVVAQLLDVGADAQVAHQHAAHARAVEARLVRLDLLAVLVVFEHEVASPVTWRSDF